MVCGGKRENYRFFVSVNVFSYDTIGEEELQRLRGNLIIGT